MPYHKALSKPQIRAIDAFIERKGSRAVKPATIRSLVELGILVPADVPEGYRVTAKGFRVRGTRAVR